MIKFFLLVFLYKIYSIDHTYLINYEKMILRNKLISLVVIFMIANPVFSTDSEIDFLLDANSLANQNIITNHSDNPDKYNLKKSILRQEVWVIVRWLAKLEKKAKCSNIFDDLSKTKPNTWACKNIEILIEKWIISKNKFFRPEDKITKAETLAMILKASNFDYEFNEKSEKNWKEQVVIYATSKWIIRYFKDYNTIATRWWVFRTANRTIIKELENQEQQRLQQEEVNKKMLEQLKQKLIKESGKYSGEVKIDNTNLILMKEYLDDLSEIDKQILELKVKKTNIQKRLKDLLKK